MFPGVTLCRYSAIISTVGSGSRGLPSRRQVSRQFTLRLNVTNQSVPFVYCMECFLGFCKGMCACVCVSKKTELNCSFCMCLTFVLWLVIAGNPSTSQSKKTIKQRFLKLLPCCKPTAAPSISQSKCSFALHTSLLPPMCPASIEYHADADTFSLHVNPLKHCS